MISAASAGCISLNELVINKASLLAILSVRILLSYFASIYVRIITAMSIKDATAGFVGYRRVVLETIDLNNIKFVGYAFQIELKYKAWINKFKIQEHPIIFINRVLGKSKMNGNIIWEALFGVLFLRLNKRKFLNKK